MHNNSYTTTWKKVDICLTGLNSNKATYAYLCTQMATVITGKVEHKQKPVAHTL